jgi:hypothetical protein
LFGEPTFLLSANLFSSPTSRGGSLSPSVVRHTATPSSSATSNSNVRHIATPASSATSNSNVYNPDNPLAGVYSPKTSHLNPFFQTQIIAGVVPAVTATTMTTFALAGDDNSHIQITQTTQRNSLGHYFRISKFPSYI